MRDWTKLIGKKFSRLTAINITHRTNGRTYYECKCDCGGTAIIMGKQLLNGKTKSCGCLWKEAVAISNSRENPVKKKFPKEFRTWVQLRNRCQNNKNDSYQNYGGRGITVCNQWNESFYNFLSDMGMAPSSKHTIDRKNNNGNYEPDNCRWATVREQNNNKGDTILVEIQGKKQSLKAWCREFLSLIHI